MNVKLSISSLLLISLFFMACPSEPIVADPISEEPHKLDLDLLTGLVMADINGERIGALGNPNNKPLDIGVFPIPASNEFSIHSVIKTISRVWIVPAKVSMDFQYLNYTQLLADKEYSVTNIESLQIRTINADTKHLTLDVSDLEAGYYRVFFELQEGDPLLFTHQIYWENIYIDPNIDIISSRTFLMGEW